MNMNKKHISILTFRLLLFLKAAILVSFCTPVPDPIASIDFGKVSKSELKESLENKNLIEIVDFEHGNIGELTFLKLNNDSRLNTVLSINQERFHFNEVISINLEFGSDSLRLFNENAYRPGKGKIDRAKVNSVLDIYRKWYGEPDFTHVSPEFFTNVFEILEEQEKNKTKSQSIGLAGSLDPLYGINRYLVWQLDDFNLMISYRQDGEDSLFSNNFIRYEAKNYKDVLNNITKDILSKSELNDYISMHLDISPVRKSTDPYTDEFEIIGSKFGHILFAESRDILKFKFDVKVEDEYGDSILTLYDLELDLKYPLRAPSKINGFEFQSSSFAWTVHYNRHEVISENYEKLRLLTEKKASLGKNQDIKLKYEIKAIIFNDGSVLKQIAGN